VSMSSCEKADDAPAMAKTTVASNKFLERIDT